MTSSDPRLDVPPVADAQPEPHERPQGMVPGRERRRTKVERGFMRLVATGGIVGLVVGLTSVVLAALLWSSRQL